jgi:DNA repair exonuclease SbcCD ATPase subunit
MIILRTVMITQPLILDFQITVRLPEILISLLGALMLGFTLHYFWSARKAMKLDVQSGEPDGISDNDNWKLKYYNDMDMQEKLQQQLRERLNESKENEQILGIELEELRKSIDAGSDQKLADTGDYIHQLKTAQENLTLHNQHINRLLEQIQLLKEAEKKYIDQLKVNENLNKLILDLRKTVTEKEREINNIRHEQRLTTEMSDRMDKAYTEYHVLQEKLQKLDNYLLQPHSKNIDYDELHESYFKLSRDYDESKSKQISLWDENQRLSRILADTEDKLREANFQRQQLQKKTSFLEDLNRDLQEVSEHHKKLESQLRRISEMESLISKPNPAENTHSGQAANPGIPH